jgi:transcriptional regulator with XRE-family HTH domain
MCETTAHMPRPATATPFGSWLRGELDHRGWGVRTLARRMHQFDPEVARRALNRYLREGSMPTQAYRAAIAEGLGISPDEMPASDDEEEEGDPMRTILRDAAVAQADAIYLALRAQIPGLVRT